MVDLINSLSESNIIQFRHVFNVTHQLSMLFLYQQHANSFPHSGQLGLQGQAHFLSDFDAGEEKCHALSLICPQFSSQSYRQRHLSLIPLGKSLPQVITLSLFLLSTIKHQMVLEFKNTL